MKTTLSELDLENLKERMKKVLASNSGFKNSAAVSDVPDPLNFSVIRKTNIGTYQRNPTKPPAPAPVYYYNVITGTQEEAGSGGIVSNIYHHKIVGQTTAKSLKNAGLNATSVKLSKYRSIYSTKPVRFAEHSGIGMGHPKKFTKPEGEKFGIELEISFNGSKWEEIVQNKLQFVDWMEENFPAWITERDGSLEDFCHNNSKYDIFTDGNVEIVSPPMDYPNLLKELSSILSEANRLQAFVPSDFYGIHITSNIFGRHIKKSATKFILTVNSKEFLDFWSRCSNRHNSKGLQKYATLSVLDPNKTDIIQLCNSNHYRSVYSRNLTGSAVEFRIFKSSVDFTVVSAILELNRLLSIFSRSASDNWISFLSTNATNNLKDYLISCGVEHMLILNPESDELTD